MTRGAIARMLLASSLMMVALAAITSGAWAKGSFDKLVIYGEESAVETSDASLLAFDSLNDFMAPYPGTPSVYSPGYLIVRYGLDQVSGDYVAVDSFRFFPGDNIQMKGFVYYEGLVNGWSEYDAKWYVARPAAVASLLSLMERPRRGSNSSSVVPSALFLGGLMGLAVGIAATKFTARSRNR